jgi:hypothetical protein
VVNLGGRARIEEKIVLKVVGAILGARYCRVKVASSTVIGWVWQFTLRSAQRHNQISKTGDIFVKISTVTFMFLYELDAVFEQTFSQKAVSAAAG